MRFQLDVNQLNRIFDPPRRLEQVQIDFQNPRIPNARPVEIKHSEDFAFRPRDPKLPDGFRNIGGVPFRIKDGAVQAPEVNRFRDLVLPRPWLIDDWKIWGELTFNDCKFVPAKTAKVEVPVLPLTRICYMSEDCARVFTVNDRGEGCVVNVITEAIEAGFTVTPNPSPNPPYPANLPAAPLVHPFAKGGINHKYQRLYVPASFYTQVRDVDFGGFYVAVVDVDPTSATYLQTISWIDCGWIPEEVAFSDDQETGVIANYMQGTATIFRASDGAILAEEVDGFPGAGAGAGGPFARSVRCANVPGVGNRAFMTLTDSTPSPGVAIINLDDPGFPRTNFTHPSFGFIDGVAVTPEKDRILLVESSGELHVVRVDTPSPVLETTINMPTGGQSYWGGIDVRPSGNLAFVATGNANSTSPTQGTTLAQVGYTSGFAFDSFSVAPQSWGVSLVEFGNPLKPHIICCSLSGMLTIIPC